MSRDFQPAWSAPSHAGVKWRVTYAPMTPRRSVIGALMGGARPAGPRSTFWWYRCRWRSQVGCRGDAKRYRPYRGHADAWRAASHGEAVAVGGTRSLSLHVQRRTARRSPGRCGVSARRGGLAARGHARTHCRPDRQRWHDPHGLERRIFTCRTWCAGCRHARRAMRDDDPSQDRQSGEDGAHPGGEGTPASVLRPALVARHEFVGPCVLLRRQTKVHAAV